MIDRSQEILALYKKHLVLMGPGFSIPKITNPKVTHEEQTAGNCRLYGMTNNAFFNTGVDVSGLEMEKYVESFGINSQVGNNPIVSEALICEKYKEHNLGIYEINFVLPKFRGMKKFEDKHIDKRAVKLFGELLLQSVVFGYSRVLNDSLREDIRDNDTVNKSLVVTGSDKRHRENTWFSEMVMKLKVLGQYSQSNIFTVFTREDTKYFIESIKAGAINQRVSFIYFKQK